MCLGCQYKFPTALKHPAFMAAASSLWASVPCGLPCCAVLGHLRLLSYPAWPTCTNPLTASSEDMQARHLPKIDLIP